MPLKKVGFQIKNGASPHLTNKQNKKINHTKPIEVISVNDEIVVK